MRFPIIISSCFIGTRFVGACALQRIPLLFAQKHKLQMDDQARISYAYEVFVLTKEKIVERFGGVQTSLDILCNRIWKYVIEYGLHADCLEE